MGFLKRFTPPISHFTAVFFACDALALPSIKQNKSQEELPAVLKADNVDGDQVTNTLVATGDVEISKGNSVVYADEVTYKKDGGIIRAIGNVRIKNIEIGNVRAVEAEIKDDFSSGKFYQSRLIFNDGSYLYSPQISRETPQVTVLEEPVYSICPNPDISADNSLAGKKRDMVSIASSRTTIDRNKQIMRSRGGTFRFYNIPFFYTPFIQIPLPAKERQSGFLHPSYAKTTNLGFGIKTPYYFNIAKNMELTTTPYIGISKDQYILTNDFRHMANYGDYRLNFEIANNKITNTSNTTVVRRTTKEYRWTLAGDGVFDFTKNTGLDFVSNLTGDRNYLRDYHTSFINYTISKVNLDYINGRSYHAIKTIKIQELEDVSAKDAAPFVLPAIDSHIETKPFLFKEKFALTSNATAINREDGLQYRRVTFIPEAKIPFNLRGNLFNLGAKFQGDFYLLDNNFENLPRNNDYEQTQTTYKPEVSFSWRLPLITKQKKHTLLVEPMINFVASSYKKNFNRLPNEDSNDTELTVSNLFINDRISGFDRNEAGERVSYGVKTSLFNKYGEFGLTVGQSYRKSDEDQDVQIRGFSDNKKSNIVGQAMYVAKKYFSLTYAFQLNESNYSNDVNQLTTALVFDNFNFSSDYLLIRRTAQNSQEREQINFTSAVNVTKRLKLAFSMSRDLAIGRTLNRSVGITRDGCCTVWGFVVTESNPSSLTKPQKTFSLNLTFKNL